jgi:hypothetical protein
MNATTYTPAQVIERYLLVRERKKELDKEYKAKLCELDAMLDGMERFLLLAMDERKEVQIKTDFGTAYRAPQLRATMVDRTALIGSILEKIVEVGDYCETNAELLAKGAPFFDPFTNHVNKEWVQAQLDNNVVPVGIDVQRFITCNVRKA